MASESRTWLIYDERSECFWGPNRGGYWKSLTHAGLYTEAEAKDAEDFARRYGRAEVAVPLSKFGGEIKRLAAAQAESEAIETLLGPPNTEPRRTESADISALREALADYNAAAEKFIAKVESGRAQSRETYADLKACLLMARDALLSAPRGHDGGK